MAAPFLPTPTRWFTDVHVSRAATALGVRRPVVIGHLLALYAWAEAQELEDGDLGPYSSAEIAEAADWPARKADNFLAALEAAGLIHAPDPDGSPRVLRDWDAVLGRILRTREGNRERKRRERESTNRPGHAPVTRDASVSHDSYQRTPDQKREEKSRREERTPDKSSAGEAGGNGGPFADNEFDRVTELLGRLGFSEPFDPQAMIEKYGLGLIAFELEEFEREVRERYPRPGNTVDEFYWTNPRALHGHLGIESAPKVLSARLKRAAEHAEKNRASIA